ncbi:MAG: GLUG motif-containing protein [Bdellovibrionota bacterium]
MRFGSLKGIIKAFVSVALVTGCMEARFDDGASTRLLANASCSGLATLPSGYYCAYTAKITNPKLTGAGTTASPYEICSPHQLNAIGADATLYSSSFKVTADLDMSCITGNHTRIGTSSNPFRGTFSGEGKTISNWKFEDSTADDAGLFAYVKNGQVSDFTLTSARVTGKDYVGLAVGRSESSHILEVVTAGTASGVNYVGGVVGRAQHGAVNQCSSSATVGGTNDVGGVAGSGSTLVLSSFYSGSVTATGTNAGGVIGNFTYGYVINSYSTGTVSSSGAQVGGVAGLARGLVKNTYSTGAITGSTGVGGLVGSLTASGSLTNSFAISTVSGSGGSSANVGRLVGSYAGTTSNSYFYSGATCDADSATGGTQACNIIAAGSQTTTTAFQSTATQPLAGWDFQNESVIGTLDEWASVTSGYPTAWWVTPSNTGIPFFDGNGTISSPYEISTTAQYNLISSNARWMGAHYKLTANLNFASTTPKLIGGYHAPFYGTFEGNSKSISNFVLSNTSQPFVGMFGVTLATSSISNLNIASATITGSDFTGGVVGMAMGAISNVTFAGTLSASSNSGGLVGYLTPSGSISGGTATAIITASTTAATIGGLVGTSEGAISKSRASTTLVGGTISIGGLVGSLSAGTVTNSYSTGTVGDGLADQVGGLVGLQTGGSILSNSYSSVTVTGAESTGGLVGKTETGTTITATFATGDVTGSTATTLVGPLFGSHAGAATTSLDLGTATCTPGAGACNASGVSSTGATVNHFYNTSNAPLTSWDFTTIWRTDAASLPAHR